MTTRAKRPLPVMLLAILESVVGLAGVSFGAYLLRLSFRPAIVSDEDVHGLQTAAAIFAIPGAVWACLAVLVFIGVRWGWWIGVTLNVAAAVAIGMDVVAEWSSSGAEDIALAATFVILTGLYLMPQVWKYRRAQPNPNTKIADAAEA